MASLRFLLSLLYFASCLAVAVCGLFLLFTRVPVSAALTMWTRILLRPFMWAAAAVGLFYGALFSWVLLTSGWRELMRDSGADMLVCVLLAVVLPFCLRSKRLRDIRGVVLSVALAAFFFYGRAYLLLGAGA